LHRRLAGSQNHLDAVEKRKIFAAASIFMVREDEGNTYLQNVSDDLPDYIASQLRRW
jgi:hypothetical protein